ncbi:molybdopterin-containing oxidoreductase family protein [Thiofilum flexile]|uniref:molybdopterin-containing oxidoreductase family protein n=1 Tax=Thiofilum flexile TaxID=125627 RepID=UPI0003653282|nr:molybdopterin oxidoreductase family protein [Thiofilum flexile]
MSIIHAACPHDCPDTCSMLISVEKGRAVKVEGNPDHPPTAGVLCTKVARYLERTYHPERLVTPLKRIGAKGSGQFTPISWDEALTTIASRLQTIAARDPEAILPYSYGGTMGFVQSEGMAARFFNKLGASQLDRTICAAAGGAGLKATYGLGVGLDGDTIDQAKVLILWGINPITSSIHFWRKAQAAKRNGSILIAIDPYRSLSAEKCDQHIALNVGTDAALALGLVHIWIRDDLLDHEYIQNHTLGFKELSERAQRFTPDYVAQTCGISVETLENLAALIGHTAIIDQQPIAIRASYGLQRVRGGGNTMRALACLPSLLGAWKHQGGGLLLSSSGFFPVNKAALEHPELLPNTPRTINMSTIGDALLHETTPEFGPKIEAVIVYNSNPVAIAPEGGKVAQGFAREDLFTVVLEHFMTDTAKYADIVLPATTQLEHVDIHKSYGHQYVLFNHPTIQPLGECKPNSEIFRLLAKQMDFSEACFHEDDETIASQAFDWSHPHMQGISFESLKAQGWQRLNTDSIPFAQGQFPTASGKCEFLSSTLAAQGLDPLPDFIPPYESVASNPELAARYPLAMISPPERHFLNSTFVNIESLRKTTPEPTLEIHPIDAAARGISTGSLVAIFNDRGNFQAKAVITDKVRAGLVVAPSTWWKGMSRDGKNCNEVTSQALTDLGNGPTFYDCLVEVKVA